MFLVRWYEKRHKCPRCATEWNDEWSCMCNDSCPACHLESSPASSRDLSRELLPEDFAAAERGLGFSGRGLKRNAAWAVTAEQARDYAEARLEGR
jgi:hypothetical protein